MSQRVLILNYKNIVIVNGNSLSNSNRPFLYKKYLSNCNRTLKIFKGGHFE